MYRKDCDSGSWSYGCPILPRSLDIVADSGSNAAFDRIGKWLSFCFEKDNLCRSIQSLLKPKRLLAVDSLQALCIFVFEPQQVVQNARSIHFMTGLDWAIYRLCRSRYRILWTFGPTREFGNNLTPNQRLTHNTHTSKRGDCHYDKRTMRVAEEKPGWGTNCIRVQRLV